MPSSPPLHMYQSKTNLLKNSMNGICCTLYFYIVTRIVHLGEIKLFYFQIGEPLEAIDTDTFLM